jgi:hypothetical protein
MRRIPLLGLTACTLFSSALAQSTDPAEVAARQALFTSCGGVEADALPAGIVPGIYRGKLGTQPISLQLSASSAQQINDHPEQVHADRYSYDRYGPDIVLERGRAANRTAGYALLAVEATYDFGDSAVRGCLDLAADGSGITGQWRSPDGKKSFPITLSRFNVAALPLALPSSPGLLALKKSDPFTFLRLNHPWKVVPGGLQEPLTQVSYPRVPGGPAALNTALQDRQLALIESALQCRDGSGLGANLKLGTDFSGTGTLTFNRGGLASLSENVDYYCGGAHPDAYIGGATLSASTGRSVPLTGKRGSIWPTLDDQKLQALYIAHYPEDADQECRSSFGGREPVSPGDALFTEYLTSRGLAIWPNFVPHVALACAEVVTLPFAGIRTFADQGGPYFRAIYPR